MTVAGGPPAGADDPPGDQPGHPEPDTSSTESLISRMLQRMPIGVLLVSPDRTIVYRNETAERLLGVGSERGGQPGGARLALFRRWDGGAFEAGQDPIDISMRSGEVLYRRPVHHLRPDGHAVALSVTAGPIVHDDATSAGSTVLLEAADEPDGATLAETVVGMLSHELRTPVTAIYGGSQLLLRPDLPGDLQASVIGDIAQEAERLHRLVEDLLAIARTERGLTAPSREPVLVQHLALAVADQERHRRPWADIGVHADLDLPPVRALEDEVRQVLRNLLSHALGNGGTDTVTVTATLVGDEVIVSVVDRGRGPAAAAGRDAFFLYHRSPAIARQVPGTGVELFVARAIVEALDGRIWIDERAGGGTIVNVALPRFHEPGTDPRPTPTPSRPSRRGSGHPALATVSTRRAS